MDAVVWNIVLTLLVSVMAFVMREKFGELSRLNILLNKTREEMARDHITRQEFRQDMQQILDRFDRIEVKLDQLVKDAK
jgi:cell division FtsZ-interacting protein ZapD